MPARFLALVALAFALAACGTEERCMPGEQRCSGPSYPGNIYPFVELCDATGHWTHGDSCLTGCACHSADAGPPTCSC